jgi:hypothetical protein
MTSRNEPDLTGAWEPESHIPTLGKRLAAAAREPHFLAGLPSEWHTQAKDGTKWPVVRIDPTTHLSRGVLGDPAIPSETIAGEPISLTTTAPASPTGIRVCGGEMAWQVVVAHVMTDGAFPLPSGITVTPIDGGGGDSRGCYAVVHGPHGQMLVRY